MKEIICVDFTSAWLDLLENLLDCEYVSPRGLRNREENCVAFRVVESSMNILVHPVRKLNYRFMIAEWIWYMRGWNSLQELTRFNPHMAKFSDDGQTLAGAYGPRLLPQWEYILSKLNKDGDTRQAVASIWTPSPAPSNDIPCTLSLQFLIREGRLNLIVTMRSSDIWLGLPYDMFSFSQMQNALAGELKVDRGWIQFNLGSSHLYQENEEIAKETLRMAHGFYSIKSPALRGWIPPLGWNPYSPLPLQRPWSDYANILNSSRTSAEALEILNKASVL